MTSAFDLRPIEVRAILTEFLRDIATQDAQLRQNGKQRITVTVPYSREGAFSSRLVKEEQIGGGKR